MSGDAEKFPKGEGGKFAAVNHLPDLFGAAAPALSQGFWREGFRMCARVPEVDFNALFNVSYSSDRTVGRLEAIAGCSLDDLPADTRGTLEEVVAARNPRRRWLAPAELTTVELIRELRPDSPRSGLTDEDRCAIETALGRK